jgi:nucleoid DNA-binding protein
MTFIEGSGVLTEAQHGFRTKKKSAETALQTFIKSVQDAIEKKMNSIGNFRS